MMWRWYSQFGPFCLIYSKIARENGHKKVFWVLNYGFANLFDGKVWFLGKAQWSLDRKVKRNGFDCVWVEVRDWLVQI